MMHNLSVAGLIKGLKNKDFSSVELAQHYLNRINKSKLNAFISVTDDLALAQANEADLKIAKGDNTLLTGIPYAHKDIFCTKGVKTSAGSKMLDSFISP
jgi:aspartyl-tRNA(Asn)/glutamyl-tRNA(Gln) amidotransferase subunit A